MGVVQKKRRRVADTCDGCSLTCLPFLFLNEFIALGGQKEQELHGSSMMCCPLDKYYADTAALWLGASPLPSASLAEMEMTVMTVSLP